MRTLIASLGSLKSRDEVHWLNPTFTAVVGFLSVKLDVLLPILAFAFVTVPLGIVQWWNVVDRMRARNAIRNSDSEATLPDAQ